MLLTVVKIHMSSNSKLFIHMCIGGVSSISCKRNVVIGNTGKHHLERSRDWCSLVIRLKKIVLKRQRT